VKVEFGKKPTRRKDGHLGTRVKVRCEGTHPKTYAFDTHGMNSTEVAEKIASLDAYHSAKMARLRDFGAVRGVEFVVKGDTYRVVDCTIFDAAVTLYLDVRRIEQGGKMRPVTGFPIRMKYRDIALIPSNAAILNMIRESLPDDEEEKEAHNLFVRKVREKVKG
jgi:hypothetical protein